MAAYSHTRAASRTSLGAGDQDLPNGSCNYRDLSIGSRAPICGCTRFWLNQSHFNANDGALERAWCFCGHHACFHDAFSQQQEEREQALANSRMSIAPSLGNGNQEDVMSAPPHGYTTPSKPLAGLGIRPTSRSQSQSINTRVFQALNEFARNQEDGEQAMSDATSKLPSTNAPSLVEESRMSPNRFIQERLQSYRPMAPPVNIPNVPAPQPPDEYSATEMATPSIAGTPDFRALASSSCGNRPSPGNLQPGRLGAQRPYTETPASTNPGPPPDTAPAPTSTVHQQVPPLDLQNILQTYGRRLDVLETLSFSHVAVEELQDRFEHFDGRILDLEHWRTDHEQAHPTPDPGKASNSKRRRLLPTETSSFGSDGSFDSNAAAHTEAAVLATLAANAETHPRIDALESRVQDLEDATLPSYARPWQVQVVLLPWGDLKGIWFSALEATQHSMRSATQLSEEWTGAQSGPKLSFKSSSSGAWTTESIQAWANEAQEWMSPKACGPSGAVFQRLASRGLVRDVTFLAPDARHILNAINTSFDDIGKAMTPANDEPAESKHFQGLLERFIPLRKVRKSARLRFLSPAEMVTSATWTASFLDASVFMKVSDGQRRLYITTPDAYTQPNAVDGWSWKRLRDLPLFDASPDEQAAQTQNIAIEACWSYNERLDRTISLHSSFASHESQWSEHSQRAMDDTSNLEQPPLSPHSDLRPQRQRTVSLPESGRAAVDHAKEALPKRRVASFEPIVTTSTYTDELGAETVAKRRRISLSPEAERRGVNFTPRWSREPPSPFTSEAAAGEARSQGAGSGSRKRGTTPFAYATPHSNSNFVGRVEINSGDGDTEVATDIIAEQSERGGGEDEWEGVEEEDGPMERSEGDGESIAQDREVDEDDLEEKSTIYEG